MGERGHAVDAEVRLYDRLFTAPEPDADGDFKKHLNPHSLEVVTAKCEASLKEAKNDLRYQFERLGYFALDKNSTAAKLVFIGTILSKIPGPKSRKKASTAAAEATRWTEKSRMLSPEQTGRQEQGVRDQRE